MIRRLIALALFACASAAALAANPVVELDTTLGPIRIELYPEAAPKTVANFLQYVKDGFYADTQFHRVIPGFMVQGGGYGADFKEKPTRSPIPIESQQSVKAGLSNGIGMVAMARTGNPNSASAQFFVNVANNKRLDFTAPTARGYGYTVFGKVVQGMDVINRIAAGPTGPGGPFASDVPKEKVLIKSAKVITE